MRPHQIAAGDLSLGLVPDIGGSVAWLTWQGIDLLRRASATEVGARNPLGMAAYPMAPYCGRLAERRFAFAGMAYRLADNFGGHPHSIHGNARLKPWRVAEAAMSRCRIELRHEAPDDHWPFRYRASQTFDLDARGLDYRFELRNEDDRPFPAGLGWHPFFRKTPETEIEAKVEAIWENDARMLPHRRSPVPSAIDFGSRRRIGATALDNGFSGWDGHAEIVWPEFGLGLRMTAVPALPHLVIYAPPGGDFVCLEPASIVGDGLNKFARGEADTGTQLLAPGEPMSVRLRLDVIALNRGDP